MKKYSIVLTVIMGLIALGTVCCRLSKEIETFYLRACETGRLIGPVSLMPGQPLPPLDEQAYIIAADPTSSELEVRRRLVESKGYESHYIDIPVDEVVEMIQRMLKHHLGDKAPSTRVEAAEGSWLPLITMEITAEEPAYDVLCNIATKAKLRISIEDGAVVLSHRPLREMPEK